MEKEKISPWKLWRDTVSDTVYLSVHISSLTSVHCNESCSGSRPPVLSTSRTLNSHWGSFWMDILLLSYVVEILYFWVCTVDPFTCISKS